MTPPGFATDPTSKMIPPESGADDLGNFNFIARIKDPKNWPVSPGQRVLSTNPAGSRILLLSDGTLAKQGNRFAVRRSEVMSMQLVREHTTILVPKPIKEFLWDPRDRCFTMELLPGRDLDGTWNRLASHEQNDIAVQICGYLQQLPSIPKPASLVHRGVCDMCGDVPVENCLLIDKGEKIDTDEDFQRHMVKGAANCHLPLPEDFPFSSMSDLVLTHADLLPPNVLVDGTKVTGIIDWQKSAWMPPWCMYWQPRFPPH